MRRFAPALLGLVLGVLALGPALGPGFVLRYDLLFVPDPPILPPTGGFPRAMPSDLVVALLSRVLPDELVQKGLLLGIFVLAASGAGALVPRERTLARLVAAAFYAWNIYLAQRLLLGQWALLLGVAGLPWAVRAVALSWVRLPLALLPAAVGGFQAMLVSALTVLPVAALRQGAGRWRGVALALVTLAVLSLPWLVPALGSGAVTDPRGVDAFAARADGPFGVLGSLLSLGGIWNAEAGVPGQQSWWLAGARLAVVAAGLFGYLRLRSHPDRPEWWTGLAVAAGTGFGIACVGTFEPGRVLLKGLIGLWPGFGPLRDGQLYLAPLVLLTAVGLAAIAGSGVRAAVAVMVPLLVLPTFAWGAFGRLAAVEYPPEWLAVQRIVNSDPVPGALLSLPWGAHRAFGWNRGRVMLDPATKLFGRRVIWDDTLIVGADGGAVRVAGEDPLSRVIGGEITPERLASAGVRYVLITGNENRFRYQLPGWDPIFQGSELLLLRR